MSYETYKNSYSNIMTDMPQHHRDDNIRRAQLREVALRFHDLNDGGTGEILLQILGDHNGDRHVLGALQDVTRHCDQPQNWPGINLEDGLHDTESYVWPHVETRPAELLDRTRFHVPAHCQRGEPRTPRFVIRSHCFQDLAYILLLKSSVIVHAVQIPTLESNHHKK